MGIPGLLPVIKSVMKPIHIKDLAGTSVAVDTYSWLHKAAFSCSRELCRGIPTRRHIDYCIHRVNLLRHNGVKPVLVFDGDILPMKSDQEAKRARSRKENLERAIEHELCGNQNAATEYYQKAVDISPLIAYQLIEVLRKEGVDYIVAPYEADAQMAYLSITNHVSAVITEDSDLIPFGCKRIIFKMDRNGNGEDFQYNELTNNIGLDFSNFTKEMLLEMCILSGCDYLQSLQGVGIKKAYELVRRFRCYKKIIKHLKYNGVSVPASYEATFGQAILTFRHQLVYDPMVEDVVHLRELPTNLECDLDVFGRSMPKNLAKAIAMGDIDPISKKSFHEEVFPCMAAPNDIPEKNILHREKRRRVIELPVQKNVLTNYFFSTSSEAKRQFKAPRIGPDIETESRLLVKNDEENLLHGNIISISEHTAGVSYAARLPECKSFSHSCLTTDVEEKLEVHDCMVEKDLNTMAHECEDLRCTSDFQRFGPSSAMNMKIRCNIESDEEKAIKSRTFNQENAATDGVESVSDFIDTSDMSHDICSSNKPLFGSQLTLHDENDAIQANDGKAHRTNGALSTHKRKHIPSFTSDLIGKKMEEDRFACNLSHLEHYSRIAEESMDRLTSTMSFRSNTAGARASGLRAPKLASVQRGCRNQSQTALLDTDLSKFAYKSNATRSLNHQSRGSLSHANSSKFAYNLDIKKSNQKSQPPLLDADFNKFAYHPGILKKGIKDLKQI